MTGSFPIMVRKVAEKFFQVRRWLWNRRATLACGALLLSYTFAALFPFSWEWMSGATADHMLSDGTDPKGLIWSYRAILRTLFQHPARYFFGAVYTDLTAAPQGALLWVPFNERILVPLLAPVTHDGTIATGVAWCLLLANGSAFYWFARVMGWDRRVALFGALSFAVNPFTRARVSVHMALAGIYHLPLVFGGLETVAKGGLGDSRHRRRDRIIASLAFLGAITVAHYHILVAILLTPLCAIFFVQRCRAHRSPLGQRLVPLMVSVAPAVALLGFWFLFPTTPELSERVRLYPTADTTQQLTYLNDTGAHPIDYFTGDIKFGELDILPWRQALNHEALSNLDRSNPHERSNGVRWLAWLIAACAVGWALATQNPRQRAMATRVSILLVGAMALYAFWGSLSPRGLVVYGVERSLSLKFNSIFPNFRVPSRLGPAVNFSVLVLAGLGLSIWAPRGRAARRMFHRSLWLLPLVAMLEQLPITTPPSAPLLPRTSVERNGRCGAGVFLPFGHFDYQIFEELRGTACQSISPATEREGLDLERHIGAGRSFSTPREINRLTDFIECTRLSWIHFRPTLSVPTRRQICENLGWENLGDVECRAPRIQTARRWQFCVPNP